MARPQIKSLSYYSQDTKDDDNLQYIEAIHGLQGYAIIHKLWKHIYGGQKGYYCEWGTINKALFCKSNSIQVDWLDKVLSTCFEAGICLFDKKMFDEHGILTSRGIQKRWYKIMIECGRKSVKIEKSHLLVDIEGLNGEETTVSEGLNGEETTVSEGLNGLENTQRKEKKRKENKSVSDTHTQNDFSTEKRENSEKGLPAPENFRPPSRDEVLKYFLNANKDFLPETLHLWGQRFFNHYSGQNWKTTSGVAVDDWKSKANNWILRDMENARKNKQPVQQSKKGPEITVSRETYPINSNPQLNEKTVFYIEEIYTQWIDGAITDENLPPGVYVTLSKAGIIKYSDQEKQQIFYDADQDERTAQKLALKKYFQNLKSLGQKNVFEFVTS